MTMPPIEEHQCKAFVEAVASRIVGAGLSPTGGDVTQWGGTGVLVKARKRRFVLTCLHIVRHIRDEQLSQALRFFYFSGGGWPTVEWQDVETSPVSRVRRGWPKRIPIVGRFWSENEIDDLALLDLDASSAELSGWRPTMFWLVT